MPGNGILIIDGDKNNFVQRQNELMPSLRDRRSVDYEFFHAETIQDGLDIVRKHRDQLCTIILDQKLTVKGQTDLNTMARTQLQNLEATLKEMMHPDTVFCVVVDEDRLRKKVCRELSWAQLLQANAPIHATQIWDSSDPSGVSQLAKVISSAQFGASERLERELDNTKDELRRVQAAIWVSSIDGKNLGIVDSIRELANSQKSLQESLSTLTNTVGAIQDTINSLVNKSALKEKLLDTVLTGWQGKFITALIMVIILNAFGINVAELLIRILHFVTA